MEAVESMVKTTLTEIEKVISTKTVIGEPITAEGKTIIPLISLGFGFGGGGGSGRGEAQRSGEGTGGGTGGGAWVRPVAVIIVDKEGARVEPVRGGIAAAIEKLSEIPPRTAEKIMEKWAERKKEG